MECEEWKKKIEREIEIDRERDDIHITLRWECLQDIYTSVTKWLGPKTYNYKTEKYKKLRFVIGYTNWSESNCGRTMEARAQTK